MEKLEKSNQTNSRVRQTFQRMEVNNTCNYLRLHLTAHMSKPKTMATTYFQNDVYTHTLSLYREIKSIKVDILNTSIC